MSEFDKTMRNTINRRPARAVYDKNAVMAILDEGLICHVGYSDADGSQFVIPTAYGREGDRLFLHGSAINRTLDALATGIQVCVTVTLIDGMVFARSAFHHSMNYRSVMIFGTAKPVVGESDKLHALAVITNHLIPGRWEETRPTTQAEVNATQALYIPLEEVSAKVRSGGPKDAVDDISLNIWAGVVPIAVMAGMPVASDQSPAEIVSPPPSSIAAFIAKHARGEAN